MRSLMRAEDYLSPAVFEAERRGIFSRLWMLVATRSMLAADGDFRTFTLAGTPLAVRNCGGTLRAFLNACRHRGARLFEGEFGNAPLVCPYHAWSYAPDLALEAVPRNRTLFQFDAAAMARLRLVEFALREVGDLVFVNLAPDPLPLEDQFAPALIDVLAASSARMDAQFVHTAYECAFNWKLGIENIKDPLHVEVLHRGTFPDYFDTRADRVEVGAMDHGADPARDGPQPALTDVSGVWDVPMAEGARDWHDLVERLDGQHAYRGIHLFPNVNLMIVAGAVFSIQIYNPVAPGRTAMQMMAATTRPVAAFPHKPLVLWEHIRSDMTVLRQDIECLESLQAGMGAISFEFEHGAYEAGLVAFHKVCKAWSAGGARERT
jgi:phenylpropionate dioxygenase-like ring-hydroxylating dioxygenase large terminal subunit